MAKSLREIRNALSDGHVTLTDLVKGYLANIDISKDLNIYVEVFGEEALSIAQQLDEKRKSGQNIGRLHGAVVSIKDVLCYKNHTVSASSRILEGFESQFTATAVQKLLDEDAIIIGRTNCDEFAMGSTNEHSAYGPTLNGLDPSRVPGGSSGAAAVSVEQETCLVALGSDTGGSVRQPAAFCGVYGMKPTYGRISRYGLIAYGSSFDQIGVLALNAEDISEVLEVVSGFDPMDATSSKESYLPAVENETKAKTFAYIPDVLNHPGLNQTIKEEFEAFIEDLKKQGHQVHPISFDLLPYLVPAYYVLTTAEASSNLSRYDGIRYGHRTEDFSDLTELYERSRTEGFGLEVKRRIMMGSFVLSVGYYDAYFTKAQKVRSLIIQRLDEVFSKSDFIITPTTTDFAWKRGEMMEDPVAMYLTDVYTVLANLGGIPAISIPRRVKGKSLPIGVQIMANRYQEHSLISLCLSLADLEKDRV